MDQEVLTQEFLDELTQRANDNHRGRLHQAFICWYVEAEFGRDAVWHFSDDVSDGGIDVIVEQPSEVPPRVIIQSKFTKRIGTGALANRAYDEIHRVVEAFRHRDRGFLDIVRDDLRPYYRRTFSLMEGVNDWRHERKAFRLVTTANRRVGAESDLIPPQSYIYGADVLRLYAQYRKGATPRARSLELAVTDKIPYRDPERGTQSYLFNARLSDFRKYLQTTHVDRLVARNIRNNLRGSVGRAIRTTYENRPADFWYYHNGLTIVCDEMTEKSGIATLVNPSVVNGAQTLYAIDGSAHSRSGAMVTTRVIVRENNGSSLEDDRWLQSVIRGVNTQNRVKAFDFHSNEPEQIELQHLFRREKVFYERKRGEWGSVRNEPRYHGLERLSLARFGQILIVTEYESGDGVLLAKRGADRFFDAKHYRRLFPSRSVVARRFKNMYLRYRLFGLLRDFGYKDSREFRRQRHAFLNCLWLLGLGVDQVDGIPARCTMESIKEAFTKFTGNGMIGRHARKVMRRLTKEVWGAWRKARKRDVVRWTPNNFFKEKFGIETLRKSAFPRLRSDLKWLGEQLLSK